MRYPDDHKAQSRERILQSAAKQFRTEGLDKVSVPAVMAAAGLTHGGFYAHFASKDALFMEAVETALDETRQFFLDTVEKSQDPALETILKNYLSPTHRRKPGTGCSFAALGPEISRSSNKLKKAAGDKHKKMVEAFADFAKEGSKFSKEEIVTGMISGMVGALVLSRLTNDEQYADQILDTTRRFLVASIAAASK